MPLPKDRTVKKNRQRKDEDCLNFPAGQCLKSWGDAPRKEQSPEMTQPRETSKAVQSMNSKSNSINSAYDADGLLDNSVFQRKEKVQGWRCTPKRSSLQKTKGEHNHMSERDISKQKLEEQLKKDGADSCCFCGTVWGALIQLHQGWCCVQCFKTVILDCESEKVK